MSNLIPIVTLVVVLAAAVIVINVWDWRRRRRMTPAQRKVEDDEIEREMQIW